MVPIYLNGKSGKAGDSFEQFSHEFMAICRSHQEEARALAFAFILYDFDHPQIAKLLRDADYWKALNKISGKYLTVFSFLLRKPYGSFNDSRKFIKEHFAVELPELNPSILFFQVVNDHISEPFIVEIRAEMQEEAFIEVKSVLMDAVESVKEVRPEFRSNTTEIFNLIVNRLSQRKKFLRVKKVLAVAQSIRDIVSH